MVEFVTANTIHWCGKTYKAQPAPSEYNGCAGCAFRWHGECHRPIRLREYTCLATLRTDRRDIIWVKGD